jgi:hypothetical protein
VRLLYSARTVDDVIGRAELHQPAAGQVNVTLTRGAPAGWTGLTGRVDATLLAVGALIDLGHDPGRIKTGRFGGTGGP